VNWFLKITPKNRIHNLRVKACQPQV